MFASRRAKFVAFACSLLAPAASFALDTLPFETTDLTAAGVSWDNVFAILSYVMPIGIGVFLFVLGFRWFRRWVNG